MVELINWKYWNIFEWGTKWNMLKIAHFWQNHVQKTGFQYMENRFLQLIFEKTFVFWHFLVPARFSTCQRRHGNKHMNLGVFWMMINQKILENSRSARVWLPLTELWLCPDESFFDVFGPNFFPEKISKKENKHIFLVFLVSH